MMAGTIEATKPFAAQFEELNNEGIPAWLVPLRKAAFSRFAELGFPTRRDEEWRSTVITPIAETPFQQGDSVTVTAAQIAENVFGDLACARLTFVNGKFAPELSTLEKLPQGIVVTTLAEALKNNPTVLESHLGRLAQFDTQAFVALNTAFLTDGAFVHIPRNAVIAEPIQLLFVSTAGGEATVSHPRTLIVAEENSQATVIETYAGIGDGVTLSNAVTEVVVAANAVVDHYKITQENAASYHVGVMQVKLARSSNFSSHSVTLGGAIVRHDANALFSDSGAECTLNGLYVARDRQLVDNHTAIDHAMPHCNSHEIYKGILDDRARGVFNGKIFVRPDAQKTDAKQTNQTLLLSKEATINTKPQLEIFADDVKCTHGATIGQLDAESLFYLRARGIGVDEARSLLTYAFASDVIDRIKYAPLQTAIHKILFAQLPHGTIIEE